MPAGLRIDTVWVAIAALLASGACGAQEAGDTAASEGPSTRSAASSESAEPDGDVVVWTRPRCAYPGSIGASVVDVDGTEIGEVNDVIVSSKEALQTKLAIGGIASIGEERVLVSWDLLDTSAFRGDGATKHPMRVSVCAI